jgi:hypothetical protein
MGTGHGLSDHLDDIEYPTSLERVIIQVLHKYGPFGFFFEAVWFDI